MSPALQQFWRRFGHLAESLRRRGRGDRYISEPPADSPHDPYFTVLLFLSGYREEATMSMVPTVNYADKTVLAESTDEEPSAFFITLSMNHVMSANPFDREIYEHQFANRLIVDSTPT